ncbi:MAG: DUF4190 domain-containing protein [Candidatus Pacearchaeota archaeon]|nr:DUF4190 domain-containing protein [Nanoarchaeota archaeon]MDZ4226643.1 DUF4190 domain-containing protein [Candidatus Pacearchaeota archaeon]
MADINFGTVAYMLGILSIVFAFFSPLAGLVLGIVGMVQSKRHKVDKARKLNMIGIILSAIFIIISVLFLIFAASSGIDTTGSFPLF